MVMYNIMDRTLLAEFTWTGKSVGNRVKMAFGKLKNISELLYGTVVSIDTSYVRSEFNSNLINKILKYAYE